MDPRKNFNILNNAFALLIAPLLFYFVCFVLLTFPLILKFHTHYFQDFGDGCQNLWNMWWVNKAVTELNQPVWWTNYLHHPHGTTLLGHTLNPFNGFVGIALQRFLTLSEAFNVMVMFGFVAGGWAAFYLAYVFSRSYRGSMLAGYIFTFSSYHFGHAQGHMQLVSLEWLPLFIAVFYLLLDGPTTFRAVASAAVLFLVVLCDYYSTLYSVFAGAIIFVHMAWARRDFLFIVRGKYLRPICVFTGLSLVTTGALLGSFVVANATDPFTPGTTDGGLDPMSLVIYGAHWRFGELTEPFWSRLPLDPTETTVHLGFAVIFVLVYAWIVRKKIGSPHLGLWYFIFFFFAIMALGPTLRIGGKALPNVITPYRVLGYLVPPLRVAGCTVRMAVMLYLSAGVIFAMAYERLFSALFRRAAVRLLFIALLVVEYLPSPMSATPLHVPPYIEAIKQLPPGAIADLLNDKFSAHYYHILHGRPRMVGLLSRYPESVERKYTEFDEKLILDVPRHSRKLYDEYRLRYILTPPDYPPNPKLQLLYSDAQCRIYGLKP
jgi:hypothetical protein